MNPTPNTKKPWHQATPGELWLFEITIGNTTGTLPGYVTQNFNDEWQITWPDGQQDPLHDPQITYGQLLWTPLTHNPDPTTTTLTHLLDQHHYQPAPATCTCGHDYEHQPTYEQEKTTHAQHLTNLLNPLLPQLLPTHTKPPAPQTLTHLLDQHHYQPTTGTCQCGRNYDPHPTQKQKQTAHTYHLTNLIKIHQTRTHQQ